MKITVEEQEEKSEPDYPRLMTHKGSGCIVFLFNSYKSGICLRPGKTINEVGDFIYTWSTDFIPYTGKVILEND